MTRPWATSSIGLCILMGAASAFPSVLPNTAALANADLTSPSALHLSFPSIQAFRLPVAAQNQNSHKTANPKGLWYRDRSSSEEQLTTPSPRPTIEAKKKATIEQADWNPFGKVNLSMVKETCMSHARLLLIGSTVLSMALLLSQDGFDLTALHWNGEMAPFHSLFDWTITPARLLEGILATMPLVALSKVVCESDQSELCPVHFSVTNTVISLFGRRRQPDVTDGTTTSAVLLVSLAIATVSALSEELIFRGMLPTVLESYSHSVEFALMGQAFLFGMGQIRRQSSANENSVFSLIQWINGLWYGSVYLSTGGDIMPVLIAHILYECHVFVGVWKMVNDQLDYTDLQKAEGLSAEEQREMVVIQQQAGGVVKAETLEGCRRFFYAFDQDHRGSLSLADVKRAVAFAFLQEKVAPSEAQTSAKFQEIVQERLTPVDPEEADRITLSEFLRLLFALKSSQSSTWSNQQFA